jgi:hypothetical protein
MHLALDDLALDDLAQPHDELVVDVGVDEKPLAGGAALTRAEERGGDRRLRGRGDVRVRSLVARDLVADDGPQPGDQVEDARRELGVDDALGELDRADRGRPDSPQASAT